MAGQPGVIQEIGSQQADGPLHQCDGCANHTPVDVAVIIFHARKGEPHPQQSAQQSQRQRGRQQLPLGLWPVDPVQFRANLHRVAHLLHRQPLRRLRIVPLRPEGVPLVGQVLLQLPDHHRTGPPPADLFLDSVQVCPHGISQSRRPLSAPGPRPGHRCSSALLSAAGPRRPPLSGDNTGGAFRRRPPAHRR